MRLRLALLVSMLVACGGKPSVSVPGGPTLGVAPPANSTPKDGPLTVTYFAPQGETRGGQLEISVSFDRPMVELGADTPPEGTITLEPGVAGRARWVGSQTLMFEPSAPLPMGTEFRVRVDGLGALDGKRLAQPLEFSFATPALALTRHSVPQQPEQKRKTPFELWFNAPVDASFVAQASTLAIKERALEFSVEPDKDDARHVRVVPKAAYPIGAKVELTVRAGLRGVQGPRPLAADEVMHLQVYSALRVLPNPPCEDDQCMPMLRFSNPVHTKDAYARLVFDPPIPKYVRNDDYVTDQLYFGEELAPGTTYTVRIEGPLKDVYGTQLGKERSAVVRTPPFPALAQLLVVGDQRPGGTGPVRAQLQHLQSAQLELYPLTFEEVLPNALEAITPKAKPVSRSFGEVGPVERKVVEIDAAEALPRHAGLVLAVLKGQGKRYPLEQRKLLAFGDLAPSLKIGQRDGVVWVTRLSDAAPVAGARVRVVRGTGTLAQGVSDARGLFAFQFTSERDQDSGEGDVAAVVEKDGELAFTQKYGGIGPWEVSGRGTWDGEGATRAHLFTERGIYRPGDTVQLKGILRDADAQGLKPSRGEITLRVTDMSDAEVETVTLPLSAYGSFSRAIRVPGSIELGSLLMSVSYREQTFQQTVEIAEFRPAELEAKLVPSRELALRSDDVQAKLSAAYLFGAPAAGAHVYWSARYLTRGFAAPGFEGFSFHDRDVETESYHVAGSGEGELDARGELTLSTKLTQVPLDGPSSLEIESSINVDSTQLSARATVDVLPSSVVVGVRPGSTVLEHDKPFEAELVALNPDGSARAGVALEASLLRRTWSYEADRWTPHDTRIAGCKQKSASTAVRCALQTQEPGLYVVRAQGKDAAGRLSRAAEYVYVWGEGGSGWGEQDERILELHAAKDTYKLGETAKILVPSPFARAEALVTVEREGVLSSERVQLGSAGTIDVAIDQRFVPNAFVSVLLVKPLGGPEEGPAFRVGTIELAADVSDRQLKVEVQPDAAEKRPGEDVTVTLAVKDAAGKPVQSELTVFAVDEGVLTLTGYRTPDPFAAIYAPHGLSVWTSDVRGALQRLLAAADEDKGGDEGGGGGSEVMRSNFSAVAAYVPSLETDALGRAALRFKLPDSTTKFRIMAVAASRDSRLGSGDASVRTKKPLMMRPLLPRVMRAGDAMSAGVVVHNETDAAVIANVQLDAQGLANGSAAVQAVAVPAHGATQVRWLLRAERVGKVSLRFHATTANEKDGLAFEREVLSPSVLETMSIAGATPSSVQEALAPLDKVRNDVGGLKVSLAAS
ncbi:MAG TPA: alpha-2-macroglobulin family protein, partial [Polyangiales bacterium]|nr:alpha-2-macroglobulin family protein [Polyangiales bacterium]